MTTRRSLRGQEVVGRPLRSCAHSSHASRIGSPGAIDALAGEFDPLALIDALARHEIDYVIVGGIAAMHHGATRRTDDLDICPRWSAENLDRLAAALRELGAELAVAPSETIPVPVIDGVLLGRMEVATWQTRFGRFDVLRDIPKSATARADYDELSVGASASEISGRAIRVADLEDIVRSKQIASRPKDREALPELEKLRDAARAARALDATRPSQPRGRQQPSASERSYQPPQQRRPRGPSLGR